MVNEYFCWEQKSSKKNKTLLPHKWNFWLLSDDEVKPFSTLTILQISLWLIFVVKISAVDIRKDFQMCWSDLGPQILCISKNIKIWFVLMAQWLNVIPQQKEKSKCSSKLSWEYYPIKNVKLAFTKLNFHFIYKLLMFINFYPILY